MRGVLIARISRCLYRTSHFHPCGSSNFSDVVNTTLQCSLATVVCSFGGDRTVISYMGFKGVAMNMRRGVVDAVYEARPVPKDHRVRDEGFGGADLAS